MFLLLSVVFLASAIAEERVVVRELITNQAEFPRTFSRSKDECELKTWIRQGYDDSDIVCERTCEEPWKLKCYKGPGCRCQNGLFRCYSGICSLLHGCWTGAPRLTAAACGPNEVFVTELNSTEYPICEPTCQKGKVDTCIDEYLYDQCRCAPGYIRDLNICVKEGECGMSPIVMTTSATTTTTQATTTPKPTTTTQPTTSTTTSEHVTTSAEPITTTASTTTTVTTTTPPTTSKHIVEDDDDQC